LDAWREAGYPLEGQGITSIAPGEVSITDPMTREGMKGSL